MFQRNDHKYLTDQIPRFILSLENLEKLSVVSIGPFTSDELKKFKVKNSVAEVHTVAGAFDEMKITLST